MNKRGPAVPVEPVRKVQPVNDNPTHPTQTKCVCAVSGRFQAVGSDTEMSANMMKGIVVAGTT